MPNTSNLALPYPGLTDAPNVPQHMQNLASAMDSRLGGGWTGFSFTNAGSTGIAVSLMNQSNAYKMLGNKTMALRVHLSFTGAAFAGSAPIELGPFPEGASVSLVNLLHCLIFRSNTAHYVASATTSATRITRMYYGANVVTGTLPLTWAAGDVIRISGVVDLQ